MWVAESIDADEARRVIGKGWKSRVLGGASVHKLITDTPRHVVYHTRVTMEEAIVVSKVVTRSGLTRNAFIRRAIAHWLIKHEGVDPAKITKLAKDL